MLTYVYSERIVLGLWLFNANGFHIAENSPEAFHVPEYFRFIRKKSKKEAKIICIRMTKFEKSSVSKSRDVSNA